MDPAAAVERLSRTAGYERRAYFALHQRAAYLLPGQPPTMTDRAIEIDASLLRSALADIPVLAVHAPFPTDPRAVAEAILRVLG
jgi:hypothetical protein